MRQAVPQGSGLGPLLSNLVVAAFPGCLQQVNEAYLNLWIYADDIVIWCIQPAFQTATLRARQEEALNAVSARFADLGLAGT